MYGMTQEVTGTIAVKKIPIQFQILAIHQIRLSEAVYLCTLNLYTQRLLPMGS